MGVSPIFKSVSQAMRLTRTITKSSSFRTSLTVDWPGRRGPHLRLVPRFTFQLMTSSLMRGGRRRQLKLWNAGFFLHRESSIQTAPYKAVGEMRLGSETSRRVVGPVSLESRFYRDDSG